MSFINKVFGGGTEEIIVDDVMEERPKDEPPSRFRHMSQDDASKALQWLNEQEELNSASCLSTGRNADDLSSSMATNDIHSVNTRPSVAYVPTSLTNPSRNNPNTGGSYPYGSGQLPGGRIRNMSQDDASKALQWLNEQEELNSASCLSTGRNVDDLSSSMATNDIHSINTRPSVAYVPTKLMNPSGNNPNTRGNYPYGSGQVPGVFSGFGGTHKGEEEPDNYTTQTAGTESERPRGPPRGSPPANSNIKTFPNKSSPRSANRNHNNRDNNRSNNGGGREGSSYYWMEYLIYTVVAIAIQIVFGRDFAFPDGVDDSTGRACTNSDVFGNNHKMCGLETTLQEAQAQVRILTPFILAGFVLLTVNLWKERRTSYMALCSAVRNINVQIASILPLPDDVTESERRRVVHARNTLSRWSLLGYELAILKARGRMDEESHVIPHLKELGLLVEGEWEAMVPGDRHTTVWVWMQTKAMKLGHEKIIDQSVHVQTICNAVGQTRERSSDLMSSVSRNQPMPYASVVGILVNYTLLLLSAWKGVEWAIWLYEDGADIYATPKMYIEIFILLATSLLFGVLYDLSHILNNPFGNRKIDIPHLDMGGSVREAAQAFAKGKNLPPSMEPKSSDGPGTA